MDAKKNKVAAQTLNSGPASLETPQPSADTAGGGLTSEDLFSAEEEHFLRAYSEKLVRLEAMLAAFPRRKAPDIQEVAALEQEAGRLLARTEQLGWPMVASAVGLDRLYFLARLKRVCDSPEPHEAIKGLQLLGRIHGVWGKESGGDRSRTALVFVASSSMNGNGREAQRQQTPAGLPFVLSADAYRVFAEPPPDEPPEGNDNDNDSPDKPTNPTDSP